MNFLSSGNSVTSWFVTCRTLLKSQLMRDIKSYLFYGNTLDYEANVIGRQNHRKSRRQFRGTYVKSFYKKYWQDGYYLAGQIFDNTLITRIQREYLHALQDDELSNNGFDDETIRSNYNYGGYIGSHKGFRRDITDARRAMPSALQLLDQEQFRELLTNIYGSDFKLDGMVAWRIYHVPKEISKKFELTTDRLHFDDHYSDTVKVFICLSDVTDEDGPFQFFPRRFSRDLLWKGFKKELRSTSATGGLASGFVDVPDLIRHVGRTGEVAFCSTPYCLHRAAETAPGRYRDVLQLVFRPCADGEMLTK